MRRIIILLLFVVAYGAVAQSFDTAKLDSYLSSLEANDKAMLSLAIVENGEPVYQRAIGFADKGSATKANQNTQYRIGSITKVFTAVMIFQLIEEGKLSLTTPLSQFYPNVAKADDITISMLLSHRSGIHNFTNMADYPRYMTQPKSKAEMVSIIERMESDFTPGSQAQYSNSGYVLLGFILEDITESDYASQLKLRITSKLGLSRTEYGGPIAVSENQAMSYQFKDNAWTPATQTDMSIPHGAGAIISTPTDVAVFLSGLFNGKLVSADSLAKMQEINQGYGRGLFQIPFYNRFAYGHTGGIDGFSSQGAYFENDNAAIVVTANGMNYPLNDVSIGVLSIYFDVGFELPDFSQQPVTLPTEVLSSYEGVFASKDIPLKITLKVRDGQLTAQATGQGAFDLTAYSATEFRFAPAGITLLFEQNKKGIDYAAFVLRQGGQSPKFTRE
ncbi:serine hydrolase domain-containing protein [Alteromonas lipolytica]|uniref:Beta-lactamase-related domain-containing protein n=1 Tax=Alteromonas lipolytica TaxID=1856405 RepID=A0A1E8FJT0_9ALTE|nr:serine hydrolase domain-containing protein [Alteromonas lipolytica]OFI36190.1 hypothetical protein BFC17_08685 [Alteromonas lipolytica]GGF78548.1 D-Ala-D-Ala carboxypeptidase [Alteromonas lipolytica]